MRGFRLSDSLALAARVPDQPSPDLDLPPVTGGGSTLSAATLTALGTLYLQAELEQAGVIPAAEALADARASLELPSERTAERLEHFAQQQVRWYDRKSRNALFARVFGQGAAATLEAGPIVNQDFDQRFAALCSAINRAASDEIRGRPAPVDDEMRIRAAASDLLANLELRQYGNTLFAGRRIQEQLEASIALLKDPEVEALFHTRGFWPTVARILEPNVPDLARLLERGQAGQHLLDWLGSILGALGGGSAAAILAPDSRVYEWAARWLQSSGLAPAAALERRVG
jgi:hypothetical protein